MIKVVTVDADNKQGTINNGLQKHIGQLQGADIDILCCQSIWRSKDGSEDETRVLSDALHMPYSCFIANHHRQSQLGDKVEGVSGLAILAGAQMWMLNSGCFQVIGEPDGTKGVVQYALVRKNDISMLVLNLQLCGSGPSQLLQLRALFSHPMLKERYGAVLLCGDRHTKLSAKKLQQAITGKANDCPHRHLDSSTVSPGMGLLCLLTAKEHPVATVTLCHTELGQESTPDRPTLKSQPTRLSLDFELNKIPPSMNIKPCLPLSFDEKWSGYKGKVPVYAA